MGQIQGLASSGSTYLQVVTSSASFTAMGVERSNAAVFAESAGAAGAAADTIRDFQARLDATPSGEVSVSRRRPERVEVLLAVWVAYLIAAAVKLYIT